MINLNNANLSFKGKLVVKPDKEEEISRLSSGHLVAITEGLDQIKDLTDKLPDGDCLQVRFNNGREIHATHHKGESIEGFDVGCSSTGFFDYNVGNYNTSTMRQGIDALKEWLTNFVVTPEKAKKDFLEKVSEINTTA